MIHRPQVYPICLVALLYGVHVPVMAFIDSSNHYAQTHPTAIVPSTPVEISNTPLMMTATDQNVEENEDVATFGQRQGLKLSLLFKAQDLKRGFEASDSDRNEINDIISQLASLNPSKEPAASYYKDTVDSTLQGKWTLAYTDAPDITSLDVSKSSPAGSILPSLPPAAQLGRIGQECNLSESTITNVIEWKRPQWVGDVLSRSASFSGENKGRVLQKVVCEAMAFPDGPSTVQLKLVGFELLGRTKDDGEDKDETSKSANSIFPSIPDISSIINEGPAAILLRNPVKLRGPLQVPFGKFEILYLDEELRIIKTGQGYYAVNMRENNPWF
uniref:Plastid lipid-associated protein/fibrillin conserved domain-containing protein n=1 Tax=Chaetoceros debilis TaxID=122233 RepID=A0A7S3QJJ2_9STRA|mmetsp:Transcript_3108/g.4578  ORF Transcript_3108/g.4578 Transcript_3108/m.4578 type:complete len:330 (+) Transcript_3108:45-1034(+)